MFFKSVCICFSCRLYTPCAMSRHTIFNTYVYIQIQTLSISLCQRFFSFCFLLHIIHDYISPSHSLTITHKIPPYATPQCILYIYTEAQMKRKNVSLPIVMKDHVLQNVQMKLTLKHIIVNTSNHLNQNDFNVQW